MLHGQPDAQQAQGGAIVDPEGHHGFEYLSAFESRRARVGNASLQCFPQESIVADPVHLFDPHRGGYDTQSILQYHVEHTRIRTDFLEQSSGSGSQSQGQHSGFGGPYYDGASGGAFQGNGVELVGLKAEFEFLFCALQDGGERLQLGLKAVGGVAAGGDRVPRRIHDVDLEELIFAGDPCQQRIGKRVVHFEIGDVAGVVLQALDDQKFDFRIGSQVVFSSSRHRFD